MKNQKIIKKIIEILVLIILIFFYYIIFQNYKTFSILFLGIPLLLSLSITYFTKIKLLYSFLIGFLIQWIIFLNVNPYPIQNDNKLAIMNYIPIKYRPKMQYSLENVDLKNIKYPIILKPIRCSGDGEGIFISNNFEESREIIQTNKLNIKEYMIQDFLNEYNKDIGILWEKKPMGKER